jgi:putative Mg2+ transporter-C (MgtC) family protein
MTFYPDDLFKLAMAMLVGGLIGAEREFRYKAAGFRTIILICMGATLFTLISVRMDPLNNSRVTANIITGIGFLGAGAIMRGDGRIAGLTTAATIWISAALGMGIGASEYGIVFAATVAILIILLIFPWLERGIGLVRETRAYRISLLHNSSKLGGVEDLLRECALRIYERRQMKTEKYVIYVWRTYGRPKSHEMFVQKMLKDSEIREFEY